jgi:hypothetical protein
MMGSRVTDFTVAVIINTRVRRSMLNTPAFVRLWVLCWIHKCILMPSFAGKINFVSTRILHHLV